MSVSLYMLFVLAGIAYGYILPRYHGKIRVEEWAPAPTRPLLNLHDALQEDENFRISDENAGSGGLTAIKDSDLRACFISPYDPEWTLDYDDKDFLMQTIDPVRIPNQADLSEFQSEAGADIAVMCRKTSIYWLPAARGASSGPPILRPVIVADASHTSTSYRMPTSTSMPIGLVSINKSTTHQNTITQTLLPHTSPAIGLHTPNNQRQSQPHIISTPLLHYAGSATTGHKIPVPVYTGRHPIQQNSTTRSITTHLNIQPNKLTPTSAHPTHARPYVVPTKANIFVPPLRVIGPSNPGHVVEEISAPTLSQTRAHFRIPSIETMSGPLIVLAGRNIATSLQSNKEDEEHINHELPRVDELVGLPQANP